MRVGGERCCAVAYCAVLSRTLLCCRVLCCAVLPLAAWCGAVLCCYLLAHCHLKHQECTDINLHSSASFRNRQISRAVYSEEYEGSLKDCMADGPGLAAMLRAHEEHIVQSKNNPALAAIVNAARQLEPEDEAAVEAGVAHAAVVEAVAYRFAASAPSHH